MKRDKKQEMWVEHLNTICIPMDEYGDRPCDFGAICDRCQNYWFVREYALKLKEAGLDYSWYEKHGYLDNEDEIPY